MDKANIMLPATLDPSITHLLQVFILHLGLWRHLEKARREV